MTVRLGHIRAHVLAIMSGGVLDQGSAILQEVYGGKIYRRRCHSGGMGRGGGHAT